MCFVGADLYLVGDGPKGTGLYRCKDADGDDRTDSAEQVLKFNGGMGEHGPHAVVHGPDGKLYVVIGNHAWAQPGSLAANSPLTRWPNGGMGPDQGKPGTTEDVLLPRQNDANGHASDILAPGGTIWRIDPDGKNPALVAAGFRNQFDAAFNPDGELFTFDSDMEWDEGLPWYRAVRVCHCTPGSDFVWRTGAANTPGYYIDSLPPVVETGRGSPTGVEFYDHTAFPAQYRGAFFICDWSIGTIWVVHLADWGAPTFADPFLFVPEVARVLRPGGLFAFSGATPLAWLAFDEPADAWDERLHRDYFGLHRWDDPEGTVEFNLPTGEWIRLFRANGLEIEDLIEVRPPAGATSTYRDEAATAWARRWPMEQIWKVRKPSG
jgi:SAM-dependent methyltransferase